MSLSDLASIGSFVSGVAVLISLVYLALQVRQAERNQRAILQQGRAARSADTLLRMADPGSVDAYWLGGDGDETITETEFRQFLLIFQAVMSGFEDTYFQQRDGMLADGAFDSTAAALRSNFNRPGYRAMHRLLAMRRNPGFRQVLDGLAAEAASAPRADLFASWKTLVAEEKAVPGGNS